MATLERLVSRRLARMVAWRPRPKLERLGAVILPLAETFPPAFFAAAKAWVMNGRRRCALLDRMRPGRMRKSFSSDI
ncbi:hypothetical protein GCM10011273_18410 [Asticcacaulis endophyticus]|uniref:Uncharacterized protein n=1 Tax=Asticcacaulis endophyticus TaxID=1395890 RepID=A0A918UT81_9CAUL|nr:hypothetical protein GCM10011273_18410 [Asticcacaulis endophyticus]